MKNDESVERNGDDQLNYLKRNYSFDEDESDDGIQSMDGYSSDSSTSSRSEIDTSKGSGNVFSELSSDVPPPRRQRNGDGVTRAITQTPQELSDCVKKLNPHSTSVALKECRDIKVGPQVHFHDTITINQNFFNAGDNDAAVPLQEMERMASQAPTVAAQSIADPISVGVTIHQVNTTDSRHYGRFVYSVCCRKVLKGMIILMAVIIVINIIVVFVYLGVDKDEESAKDQKVSKTNKKCSPGPGVIQDLAYHGCYDKLKQELDKGFPVNKANRKGSTFLHKAAHSNRVNIASLLLARGADIEAKRHDCETPLHSAAFWGSLNMTRFLIRRGARIDSRMCPDESTPLHRAAKSGSLNTIKELLTSGADYCLTDKAGNTAQKVAEKFHQDQVADWLRSYANQPEVKKCVSQ